MRSSRSSVKMTYCWRQLMPVLKIAAHVQGTKGSFEGPNSWWTGKLISFESWGNHSVEMKKQCREQNNVEIYALFGGAKRTQNLRAGDQIQFWGLGNWWCPYRYFLDPQPGERARPRGSNLSSSCRGQRQPSCGDSHPQIWGQTFEKKFKGKDEIWKGKGPLKMTTN